MENEDLQPRSVRRYLLGSAPMFLSMFVHMVLIFLLAMVTVVTSKPQETVVIDAATAAEETLEMEDFSEIKLAEAEFESDLSEMVAEAPLAESLESQILEADSMPQLDTSLAVASLDSVLTSDALMREISSGGGGDGAMFGAAGMGAEGGMAGDGLIGRFFDLKQDKSRKPIPYSGKFPEYIQTMNRLIAGGITDAVTQNYYEAETRLYLSQLLIPNADADEAPKAFHVQGEVEPRGWFVHYSGTVIPPESGEWRFVGFFDDMLLVFVNNKPVLDGSWVPMYGPAGVRQEFGGPGVSGDRTAYAGKWIKLNGPARIDILIGETPGGKVGGLLMCQRKGEEYELRADGTPILPLFAVSHGETIRVRQEPFARAYGLMTTPPLWKTVGKRPR